MVEVLSERNYSGKSVLICKERVGLKFHAMKRETSEIFLTTLKLSVTAAEWAFY